VLKVGRRLWMTARTAPSSGKSKWTTVSNRRKIASSSSCGWLVAAQFVHDGAEVELDSRTAARLRL
jgi:hypothetical protein